MCSDRVLASSNDDLRLNPCSGDCVTPRICVGGSMPNASSTVGTMSIAWQYWLRISPLGLDPLWPNDHERIGHSAAVSFALPAPERRVTRVCPAPGVVVEVLRTAQVIDRSEILLQVVGHVVEE